MHLELRLTAEGHATRHEVWAVRNADTLSIEIDGETHELSMTRLADGSIEVRSRPAPGGPPEGDGGDGRKESGASKDSNESKESKESENGYGPPVRVRVVDDRTALVAGHRVHFDLTHFEPGGAPGEHHSRIEGEGAVRPPMPGKIVRLDVAEGDTVQQGQTVAVLEAMKMQSTIEAPRSGTVVRLQVGVGDAVDARDLLCEIEPSDPSDAS